MNEDISNSPLPRNIRNVVKITRWIIYSIVDRRWHYSVANCEASCDHLNRAAGCKRLTTHRLEGRDRNIPGVLTKGSLYPGGLRGVIVNHRIAMRTDVVDIAWYQLGMLIPRLMLRPMAEPLSSILRRLPPSE